MAGLLEIADEEFVALRNELGNYATTIPDEIARDASSVLIDQASLLALMRDSDEVRAVDEAVGVAISRDLQPTVNELYVSLRVVDLESFTDLSTIGELRDYLTSNVDRIAGFAAAIYERADAEGHEAHKRGVVPRGISIFYAVRLFVSESGMDAVKRYVMQMPDVDTEWWVSAMSDAYAKADQR